MKKIFLISVIFFTALANQSQPVFEKIFDYSMVNGVFDMILTSDSSLLIYGSVGNPGSPVSYVLLIKTDLAGEIIWQKNFLWEQTCSWGKQIIESSTGFYYFTGSYFYKPLLMKINKDGDTIWSKKWSADPDFPRNISTIKQMSINKFIMSCEISWEIYNQPPSSYMMVIDTLGYQFCTGAGVGGSVHQTRIKDDNYYVLGMNWNNNKIVICKNLNCSITDFFNFDANDNPYDFEFDDQQNLYFTGSSYQIAITKINSAGTILWTNNLIPGETVSPFSIIIENNKIITTGGISLSMGASQFFLSVCDTTGVIDTVYVDQTYYAQIGQKIIKVGNDLYVTGILRVEEPPSWHPVIFLRKYSFDSLTTSISIINSLDRKTISVFPNPANDYVIFESFGFSALGNGTQNKIQITNAFGQPVAQWLFMDDKTTWDCRQLPPGIYFYQFQTTEKTYTGKFLIIK